MVVEKTDVPCACRSSIAPEAGVGSTLGVLRRAEERLDIVERDVQSIRLVVVTVLGYTVREMVEVTLSVTML